MGRFRFLDFRFYMRGSSLIGSAHLGLEVLKKRFSLYEKRSLCEKERFAGRINQPDRSNFRANSVDSHRVYFHMGVHSFSLRLRRSP